MTSIDSFFIHSKLSHEPPHVVGFLNRFHSQHFILIRHSKVQALSSTKPSHTLVHSTQHHLSGLVNFLKFKGNQSFCDYFCPLP